MDSQKGTPIAPGKPRGQLILFIRDMTIAFLFVAFILLAMFAYSGLWPPLVVVESNSMMHGDGNTSHIGAIDTGDLVLVKKVEHPTDIVTYMQGLSTGHKTYGDYGDVVIYKKGGSDTLTPIIHRALIYLDPNPDGTSYRSTSLRDAPSTKWSVYPANDTWDHLTGSLTLHNLSYNGVSVQINIAGMIRYFILEGINPEPGFITKGDHNQQIDQNMWGPAPVVAFDWVIGKASGEIPWFGLLKLWFTGSIGSPAPDNSVTDLWISLILIVLSPIAVDITVSVIEKRKKVGGTEAQGADHDTGRDPTPPSPPGTG